MEERPRDKMPRDGVLRVMFTGAPDILGHRAPQAPPPRAWKVTRAPDPARARPDFRPSINIYSLEFCLKKDERSTEEATPRPQMSKLQEMLVLRKTALGARDSLTSEDLKRLQRCTEVVKRLGHFAKNSHFENLLRVQQRQEKSRQKSGGMAAPQSIQRRFGIRCRFVAFAARYVTFQESTSARADSQRIRRMSERGMQGGAEDTRRKEDERDERDRLEAMREAAEKRQGEGRSEEQRREAKERRRQEFEMAEAEAAREPERLLDERAKREYNTQRQAQERRTTEPERAEARWQEERTKEEEAAREREEAVRERERQHQEEEVRRREEKIREMIIEREARLAARARERQQRVAEEALRKQHEERRREQEAVMERERERERHNTLSLQRSQEEAKRRKHAKEEAKQWEEECMMELEAVRGRGRQRAEDEPKRQTRKEEECETVPVALVGRGLDVRRGLQLESESSRLRVHTSTGIGSGPTTSASSPEHQEARLAARSRHEKGICDVCRFPVTSYQHRTKDWRGAYVHISCLNPEASGALHLFRGPRGLGGEIESLVISNRSNLQVSNHTSSMNPADEQAHFIDDDAFYLLFQKQIGRHQFPPPHMNDERTGREWSLPPGLGGEKGQVNREDSAGRGQQQESFDEHDYRLKEHDNRLNNVTVCGVSASSLHDTWDWLSRQSVPALPPPGTLARASEDVTLGTRWLF